MTASSESRPLAVVTGASTGIGAATARELARNGFHVLAGVRKREDAKVIEAPGIEPVILDITNPDHIRALVARVETDPQGRTLWALVNNAGVPLNVPVEVLPLDGWRRLFEVNLFGHVAMIQALLPTLVRGRGRVVNISSVGGKVALPTYGPYGGTKFALEAVSDALRREISPSGVQVIVVEPGSIRTRMLEQASTSARELASAMTPEQSLRYDALVKAIAAQTTAAARWGRPPEAAAKVITKAVTAIKPKTRYTVGRDAALIALMARILPDRLLDRVLDLALRPYRKPLDP